MTKINKAWWNHSIDELEQAADSDGVVRDNKEIKVNIKPEALPGLT